MHAAVNGTRLWFDIDGPEPVPTNRALPTLMLVHGGPGGYDHSYLRPYFGRLTGLARIVYLDLRNHGRSAREDPARWSFELCADDLRAFCDQVGISDPIVLGHSMGGFVAMLYAAQHPEHPRAVILQSTMARFDLDRLTEAFRTVGGDTVAELARRDYSGERISAAEWERVYAAFGPRVPSADERARVVRNTDIAGPGMQLMRNLNILDALPSIRCPTLVSVGSLDPVTPVGAAREIVERLRPGVGELTILDGMGHFPWLDAPERYFPTLEEFLAAA